MDQKRNTVSSRRGAVDFEGWGSYGFTRILIKREERERKYKEKKEEKWSNAPLGNVEAVR